MKITLFAINGSYNHTSAALRRLRPRLISEGFEPLLIEFGLRDTDMSMLDALYTSNASVYGFSCYIWNITRMLTLAENLKALRPDAIIVLGGPEVSYDSERFDLPFVDCVIRGAGETALPSLCADIRDSKPFPRRIDGGEVGLTDGILYENEHDLKKTLYYESSVGCPFSCSFCLSSATRGVRAKSAEQTLSELYEFERFEGDFIVKLIDRTFNFDVRRARDIWTGLLDPKYTKRYQFEVCASLMDEHDIELLSRFAPNKIQLEAGLQSTNEKTLAAVARHHDVERTLSVCRAIKKRTRVHLHLDLIAGLPYEDYDSFGRSFDAAYPVCEQLQLGFLKLLHGTALRDEADKYGYKHLAEPPYTVLQNDFISYSELRRLQEISDLLERFKNSGRFERTMAIIDAALPSPFAFFEGLLDHISANDGRSIRRISQNDAYSLLFSFAKGLPDISEDKLSEALHTDYAASEVRHSLRLQ